MLVGLERLLNTLCFPFFSWSEKWFRRWRGVFCDHSSPLPDDECSEAVRDFRLASCKKPYVGLSPASGSKDNLLEDLKTKMECDVFNGGGTTVLYSGPLLIATAFTAATMILNA